MIRISSPIHAGIPAPSNVACKLSVAGIRFYEYLLQRRALCNYSWFDTDKRFVPILAGKSRHGTAAILSSLRAMRPSSVIGFRFSSSFIHRIATCSPFLTRAFRCYNLLTRRPHFHVTDDRPCMP